MAFVQVDALRPLKTKAASLGLLEKEVASKDELIASLQRQASASARSSPSQAGREMAEHHAGSQRTSMEVIVLQAEVRTALVLKIVRPSCRQTLGIFDPLPRLGTCFP